MTVWCAMTYFGIIIANPVALPTESPPRLYGFPRPPTQADGCTGSTTHPPTAIRTNRPPTAMRPIGYKARTVDSLDAKLDRFTVKPLAQVGGWWEYCHSCHKNLQY